MKLCGGIYVDNLGPITIEAARRLIDACMGYVTYVQSRRLPDKLQVGLVKKVQSLFEEQVEKAVTEKLIWNDETFLGVESMLDIADYNFEIRYLVNTKASSADIVKRRGFIRAYLSGAGKCELFHLNYTSRECIRSFQLKNTPQGRAMKKNGAFWLYALDPKDIKDKTKQARIGDILKRGFDEVGRVMNATYNGN